MKIHNFCAFATMKCQRISKKCFFLNFGPKYPKMHLRSQKFFFVNLKQQWLATFRSHLLLLKYYASWNNCAQSKYQNTCGGGLRQLSLAKHSRWWPQNKFFFIELQIVANIYIYKISSWKCNHQKILKAKLLRHIALTVSGGPEAKLFRHMSPESLDQKWKFLA